MQLILEHFDELVANPDLDRLNARAAEAKIDRINAETKLYIEKLSSKQDRAAAGARHREAMGKSQFKPSTSLSHHATVKPTTLRPFFLGSTVTPMEARALVSFTAGCCPAIQGLKFAVAEVRASICRLVLVTVSFSKGCESREGGKKRNKFGAYSEPNENRIAAKSLKRFVWRGSSVG